MWSCTPKDTGPVIIHENARDNHKNATSIVVSIEDNLPDMHSFTMLILAGDTLLFHDNKGDLQFAAYDIYADTTIGQFGKLGNGPCEIANFGATFYDPNSRRLYGRNSNQNKIVNFYLPEAVADPDYNAVDKFKLDSSPYPFVSPCYINDTTVICAVCRPNGTAEFQLGKFNLLTKEVSTLDSVIYHDKARFALTVAPEVCGLRRRRFPAGPQPGVFPRHARRGHPAAAACARRRPRWRVLAHGALHVPALRAQSDCP